MTIERRDPRILCALALVAFGSEPALAQNAPLLIDRSRMDRAPVLPAPETMRPAGLRGRIEMDGVAAPAAPSPFREARIAGSSLPAQVLLDAWRDRVGVPLDAALVNAIAARLLAAYQRSDVAFFSIVAPDQDLAAGALDIVVIEGHIADIEIQSETPTAPDLALARSYAAHLLAERPLRRATLERTLSLIRDIPGERIEARLSPGQDHGAANLTLAMDRNRADVGVTVSNRGTPLLGRTQANADLSLYGLLHGGDRTDLAVTLPVGEDLFSFVSAGYSTFVGSNGARVAANISHLTTQPKGASSEGEATAGGITFSYPITRSYTRNLSASLGLDALNTQNAVLGQLADTSRTRALRASLAYSDANERQSRSLALIGSAGLGELNAYVNPLVGEESFAKLSVQGAWSRLLMPQLALRLRFQGQTTADILPASELFALGGDEFGRAYPSAIIQGDDAIAGALETAFLAGALLPPLLAGSEAYVFLDGGSVWLHDRPLLPGADFDLSSIGAGVRIGYRNLAVATLELAGGLDEPYPGAEADWRLVYRIEGRR
ncbi:MAG: ShlB/FhaC/HecB family hemolysin secretion/activation protein [Hyphomonadaceae bacterium]|nr:ShlB/FhaC/HecB family hemolysin secretion/activation protein [Hyphomonadaceae bacterium]